MKTITGNIELKRVDGKLDSISVVMPIWDRLAEDGFISIDIPLFHIKTVAKNEIDSEIAIREAITSFCISAEKFGKGLEIELKLAGWSFISQTETETLMAFNLPSNNTVINQVLQTGEQFAEKLQIAS